MVMVNAEPFAEYPHPETHNDPAVNATITATRMDHRASCDLRRFFAKPNSGMNPHGMTQPKASLPPGTPCGACFGAVAITAGSIMVTVLMTGAPLGVTLAGLKLQVVPEGNPLQLKLIGRLNPFSGIKVTVRVDGCPGMRLKLGLLITIAYSGAETVTIRTVEMEGASLVSPP
jgi:hypothetical protein